MAQRSRHGRRGERDLDGDRWRPPTAAAVGQVAVVTAALAVPSFGDVAKYGPHPVVMAGAVTLAIAGVTTAAFTLLARPGFRRVADAWPASAVMLAAIAAASFVLYQGERSRIARGAGGTQAQALFAPDQALVHGHHLYSVVLMRGNPVSPGPLWLIVNVPFSFPHLFPLLLPFWLTVAVVVLRRSLGRRAEVAVGLGLLCCSPHLYVMLAEGQDLLVLGALMVALVALAHRLRPGDGASVALGLSAAVIANSRVIYLLLPVLLGLFLARRDRRRAWLVGAIGVAVAGGAHLVASVGTHPYPPAHLFGRATTEPTANIAIGITVTAVIVVVALRRLSPDVRTWFTCLAWCVALPHAFIGLGELEALQFTFRSWEGANYLFVGAAAVLAAVLAARSAGPPIGRTVTRSDVASAL
ncbi:MAG: hypothetical protein M3137_18410 [Actinomycetota bacterium]|nr:hypothetical protein [Actinomycetota bacterium]